MKHLKLYESDHQNVILKKCKILFSDAWNDTLNMSRMSIEEKHKYVDGVRHTIGKFMLSSNYDKPIQNDNVLTFIALLDFLRKVEGITFRFSNNRFQIHLDSISILENFIQELEIINQSKKYNL